MRCASCGFENPKEAKFCEDCGTPFMRICPSCGQQIRSTAKFCSECGTTLTSNSKGKRQRVRKVVSNQLSVVSSQPPDAPRSTHHASRAEGERRQLTVMFCDLVGSTALSEQLDPEEWREVVRAYHQVSAGMINRYAGHTAQHLGDGLLVYFGYPAAHEDDAQRAVRAGLEIITALQKQVPSLSREGQFFTPSPFQGEGRGEGSAEAPTNPPHPSPLPKGARELHVRIGIHTGLVVIGEVGSSEKREILALGDTPNLAARLQGLAVPDTLLISAATQRLIIGLFDCQDLGRQEVKGVSTPLQVYRVLRESSAQSRLEVDVSTGKLTPLVGRANEVGLVLERWATAQAGEGQVVLLSGEPGIGKSRLVQEVKERVVQQGTLNLEYRCSPYYQNSALYPVIAHMQRVLHVQREDTPEAKLEKLRQTLVRYHFPQADTLPLLAALLSLPQPEGIPPLTLSPQKQKQKTQEALVAWLVEEAEHYPVYCVWEDLHWADPSTLELLGLLIDQVPTTRLLVLLTTRPEFTPPWSSRTLTPLTLTRLPRTQAADMIDKVTGGKPLPAEVQHQIVRKTDGVPLFVEELTKMVLESGWLREADGHYELTGPLPPLAIPATLHDSLMARLDRLATVKEVAQVGATLGREFSYEVLQAVSPVDAPSLQQALAKLVDAQVLYQRGAPPQSRYTFKHALIQDATYQSLLKSKRQQYHQQIAHVLEGRFVEIIETQPELVAHHYTEAGLIAQAIPYWQRAGERAVQRSANVEAIGHLTKGLALLEALPDTPERAYAELVLQTTLGHALTAIKGWSDPGVGAAYARSLELCQQVGDSSQLSRVLFGLWAFYVEVPQFQTAQEMGEQLLSLAQKTHDQPLLAEAHFTLGFTSFFCGELALARDHLQQGIALRASPQGRSRAALYGLDPGVPCQSVMAYALWLLGYPDQALKSSGEARTLAQELSHPYSSAIALYFAAAAYQCRGEELGAQEQAEALIRLCTEQGFTLFLAWGTILRGWVLAALGEREQGITHIQQGVIASRATGGGLRQPYWRALLAEAYGKVEQVEEGLSVLTEALAVVDKTNERWYEAELYRLKGQLTLQKFRVSSFKFRVPPSPESLAPNTQAAVQEAEECFLKAIEIAQHQQAKSLELRAAMSLARLWQQQGKQAEAHQLLSEIYGWFKEGFETKDLQEAKVLLDELSGGGRYENE